jgi:hypothetical protein
MSSGYCEPPTCAAPVKWRPHIGVMRGLHRADHGLFVTVCRRQLGGIVGSGRARAGLVGGPRPATSAGIADRESRLLALFRPRDDARRRAWNGSWNGAPGIPVLPVLSVRFPVLSVLLVRPLSDAVVMVRRRSTVRFRNGAPAQRHNAGADPPSVGTVVGTNVSAVQFSAVRQTATAILSPVVGVLSRPT